MSTSRHISLRIPRPPISSLPGALVRDGLLTDDQVAHALAMSRNTSTTWLEHLMLTGLLDELDLARVAGTVSGVPTCALARLVSASRDVIDILPIDCALGHRAVPVWLEPDGDICVAMIDPTDERAITELAFFTGRRVLRECARATAIAWALHAHYGADTALWSGTGHAADTTSHLKRVFAQSGQAGAVQGARRG